jgi:hypothetical protein
MATTNKNINLYQLDKELGFQGLVADFNDPENKIIKPADNSKVTEKQLEAAIEVHIAGPSNEEIRLLNRQEGLAKLKELGFTDDQISALLNI